MLTSDLALSWRRGKHINPRLIDRTDDETRAIAADLVHIVRTNVGRRRGDLEQAFDEYIGSGTDYKILRGLMKLLVDRCEFATPGDLDPIEIRRHAFLAAAAHHPVSSRPGVRRAVVDSVADSLGLRTDDVETLLYADLQDNQVLGSFEDLDGDHLIDLYNLAQAQALLYRSVGMTLWIATNDTSVLRRIFDAIKSFRLVYTLTTDERNRCEIRLTGPVSMFHRSQKYGVQMAVFLPHLLACPDWSLRAEIDAKPRGTAIFELDHQQSVLRPVDVLGPIERHPLVQKVLESTLKADPDWIAVPSTEILHLGRTALVPDVTFRRADGPPIYLEVLGFWTPKHVSEKIGLCERAGVQNVFFAASEDLRASRDDLSDSPSNLVLFKSSLDFKAIRPILERISASMEPGS